MSQITTRSLFYYGTTVTLSNRSIDFKEGAGSELQATLPVGSYSATDYAAAWALALNTAGTQAYTVTFNRTTQKMTITAPGNFTLLSLTGTRAGTAAWTMAGFSTAANTSSATSQTAGSIMGFKYQTQYPVFNYTSPDHSIIKEGGTYNVSTGGVPQVVSFYEGARIQMNIKVITNKTTPVLTSFYASATGITDALTFMRTIMDKGYVEFMPDVATPGTFYTLFLEGTKEDASKGLKFELKNMGVPDFYETGTLTFRKVV